MNKNILFTIPLLLFFVSGSSQETWKLTGEKNGIKTYSKKTRDVKINAVKLEAVFQTTLSQLTAVITDVSAYDAWIFNSRSTRLLKQVSPSELYYYSEVVFPWPAVNRDFVSHVIISQNPVTREVNITANNVSGWEPKKSKLVRIEQSEGIWILTPLSKNEVAVTYTLQVDPGGDLPAWIINSFSHKGLLQTFMNLRTQLSKTAPTVKKLPFITD
eukprot:Opistho-1_new@41404